MSVSETRCLKCGSKKQSNIFQERLSRVGCLGLSYMLSSGRPGHVPGAKPSKMGNENLG